MSQEAQRCPICKGQSEVKGYEDRDAVRVSCRRCGQPSVTGTLARSGFSDLSPADTELLAYLPAYTRQATERGERPVVGTDNWRDMARAHAAAPLALKVRKLLELIRGRSKELGARAGIIPESDYPLVDVRTGGELHYLLQHAISRGYVEDKERGYVILTVKGWQELEPAGGQGIPGRCFVAMSFDPSLETAWSQGIYLAVKDDCKCDPIRIDKVHHNEKICDKILAEIRLAQFVIADVTLQRPGVYFEAGFAMALGRPVVWTCRKDDFDNVHFDTRQYPHIIWSNPDDLREQLRDKIVGNKIVGT